MRDIALYYPHIHVRDDTWLKAAALYWPKMARMTPAGYPKYDSPVAQRLSDELDFFVNIYPGVYAHPVSCLFANFIRHNCETLQARYGAPHVAGLMPPDDGQTEAFERYMRDMITSRAAGLQPSEAKPHYRDLPPAGHTQKPDGNLVGWIHQTKFSKDLCSLLERSGLGAHRGEWVAVAPELATVYIASLAEWVASANDLAVVTDQPDIYGTLNGWDFGMRAHLLLGDGKDDPEVDADEVGAMYAALAIQTVVPAGLAEIPVEKIIKVRRKLSVEFDNFRDHLNLLADKFTEIGRCQDATVLQARLQLLVERDLRQPTDQLERSLRQLGLEPARAVLGMQSLELPATAAAVATAAALPPVVGQAGLVAARLVTSAFQDRTSRQNAMQSGPAGYLLGIKKELTAGGIMERLHRMLLRAQSINRARRPAGS